MRPSHARSPRPAPPTTVRLHGELDYTNTCRITGPVRSALDEGAGSILVDLDEVDFMSAAALGALVRSRNTCRREGAALSVRCTDQRLLHLFTVTGLDGLVVDAAAVPSP